MIRRITQTLAATTLGLALLWYTTRQLTTEQIAQAVGAADLRLIGLALFAYWLSLAFRTRRWFGFLSTTASVRVGPVGRALVAGYAANNVLPARLGEFVRADYAKRVTTLSRSILLGSIGLERICDGLVVVGFLITGLTFSTVAVDGPAREALLWTAWAGAALFGGAIGGVALLTYQLRHEPPLWFQRLARVGRDFLEGAARITHAGIVRTAMLSLLIWGLEAFALHFVLRGLGIELSVAQTLVYTGAASLSTLIPTAPGYLGTYQLAFWLSAEMFGLDAALSVIGATMAQLFLFGSVVLAGGALFIVDREAYAGRVRNVSVASK